jgi:hypothetical protein
VAHYVIRKWQCLPWWAICVALIYIVGFIDGTAVHAGALATHGWHAYSSFTQPSVRCFLLSLIVLDPLAAVLMAYLCRAGVIVAVVTMILDVSANWIGNWPNIDAVLFNIVVISVFGFFVVTTSVPMLRSIKSCEPTPRS